VFGIQIHAMDPLDFSTMKREQIPEGVTMTFFDSVDNLFHGMAYNKYLKKEILQLIPNQKVRKVTKSVTDFKAYIKFFIERAKKSRENFPGLLQFYVDSLEAEQSNESKPETQKKLEDIEEMLISNAFIFLFAGHETTSIVLNWALRRLCRHPKVQQKVFKEVELILKGKLAPSYDDVSSLTYTYHFLKETLRFHPPISVVPKRTEKDVTIEGIPFEKGTQFGLCVYGLHMDPEVFENPQEFNPDRFLNNQEHWYPFSYGQRNCIGFRFAEKEITILICMIMRKFEVRFKEGIDVDEYFKEKSFINTAPLNDLPFVFIRRDETPTSQ
jgi:cytochrome P450